MPHVEVYVMPVPVARLDDYISFARDSAVIWLEHGALSVQEAVADDLSPGTRTSFPRSVELQEGETVVCAHILFRDKADCDRVRDLVFNDPRMEAMMDRVPVDGARMFWSGFTVVLQA